MLEKSDSGGKEFRVTAGIRIDFIAADEAMALLAGRDKDRAAPGW